LAWHEGKGSLVVARAKEICRAQVRSSAQVHLPQQDLAARAAMQGTVHRLERESTDDHQVNYQITGDTEVTKLSSVSFADNPSTNDKKRFIPKLLADKI
jgi:hypothetical protein